MARAIAILSGKGGVGKSTITANLAYALTQLGEDTIAVDSNLTTPHLGLQLGLHLVPKTLHDVLRGEEPLENTIYFHPFGFRVVPSSININDLSGVDPERLIEVVVKLSSKCDIILLDAAPGLGREAICSIKASDEVIIVTNPNLSSIVDALKTLKIAEDMNKKIIGVIVNRVTGAPHEMKEEQIENLLNMPILLQIPEDSRFSESLSIKMPLVAYKPNCPASIEINKLAHIVAGRKIEFTRLGLLERIKKWFSVTTI